MEGRTDYSVVGGRHKSATVGLFLSDRAHSPTSSDSRRSAVAPLRLGYRFVANQAVEEVNGSISSA
jgi:hypothetical protein